MRQTTVALPIYSARRLSWSVAAVSRFVGQPVHDWHLCLVPHYRQTQIQMPRGHRGGGGPPHQPGPPQPGPRQPGPPQPGPPQPGPPQPRPPPCQPPPCQPSNCTCWTAPGAACGAGAALATPASPMAERPSAPAIAPVPTIFFRVMAIPLPCKTLNWNIRSSHTRRTLDSQAMNQLYPGSAACMWHSAAALETPNRRLGRNMQQSNIQCYR
jgi:hypothetical protein